MNRIVLIKKYSPYCQFWPNLLRKKQIAEFSIEEILKKYQGFEGEIVSSFPINKLDNNFFENTSKFNDFSLLCIFSKNIDIPILIEKLFTPVGYDFGVCEEDQSIYSSLFNEILFGSHKTLISWKNKLNVHFLFETRSLAENYASLHHQLLLEGQDVEDDDVMKIYEIWKYKE